MASLGFTFTPGLDIDLILQSLPKTFSSFVMQYNMGKYENTRSELLNMLKEAEGNILSDKSQVLLVGETSKKKRKPNSNFVKYKGKKAKKENLKKRKNANVSKDKGECFHCGIKGHWKRNCKKYLEEIVQEEACQCLGDTGCTTHICNDMQVMTSKRKLAHGEMVMRLGNGAKVAAMHVGRAKLSLSPYFVFHR
ncbi:uncharacterized protein LOC144713502 [Wolffia australiana]